MAKVPGTPMIGLATGQALLAVVQNPHASVKQPPRLRLGSLIGGLTGDLYHRTLFNLRGAEDTELDTDHRLDVLLPITMKSF
jgi:hypothetical protein